MKETNATKLKAAIEIAKGFVSEMSGEPENVQLEEVAFSNDKKNTEVVLSFDKKIRKPNSLQKAIGLEGFRNVKKIVVENSSGQVLGMYNWSFERREAA